MFVAFKQERNLIKYNIESKYLPFGSIRILVSGVVFLNTKSGSEMLNLLKSFCS